MNLSIVAVETISVEFQMVDRLTLKRPVYFARELMRWSKLAGHLENNCEAFNRLRECAIFRSRWMSK